MVGTEARRLQEDRKVQPWRSCESCRDLQNQDGTALSLESALALIESVKDRKVLFIGETIIDEYRYVAALSKPPKESILAVRQLGLSSWLGGAHAAKTTAASFCKAGLLSQSKHIHKTRFVEENYNRKLFEVQSFPHPETLDFIDHSVLEAQDCIAFADFGHEWITEQLIEQVAFREKSYLAVSAQSNAANYGFNLITKYPRADYICIDESEARLAAADKHSPIEAVMWKLAEGRCEKMIVTHGRHGAYGLHKQKFLHMPSKTGLVVDTMGAGDAFFAVTAPMAEHGSIEDLLMIGNAAGSLKTQILGHRESVTKAKLIEYLKTNA